MTYEEFIARAQEAKPRPEFAKELRQLFVDNGTLQLLVLMVVQLRDDSMEQLARTHMVSQEAIYQALGRQGQVHGVEIVLHAIHEAMTNEPATSEVPAEQRNKVP